LHVFIAIRISHTIVEKAATAAAEISFRLSFFVVAADVVVVAAAAVKLK